MPRTSWLQGTIQNTPYAQTRTTYDYGMRRHAWRATILAASIIISVLYANG